MRSMVIKVILFSEVVCVDACMNVNKCIFRERKREMCVCACMLTFAFFLVSGLALGHLLQGSVCEGHTGQIKRTANLSDFSIFLLLSRKACPRRTKESKSKDEMIVILQGVLHVILAGTMMGEVFSFISLSIYSQRIEIAHRISNELISPALLAVCIIVELCLLNCEYQKIQT